MGDLSASSRSDAPLSLHSNHSSAPVQVQPRMVTQTNLGPPNAVMRPPQSIPAHTSPPHQDGPLFGGFALAKANHGQRGHHSATPSRRSSTSEERTGSIPMLTLEHPSRSWQEQIQQQQQQQQRQQRQQQGSARQLRPVAGDCLYPSSELGHDAVSDARAATVDDTGSNAGATESHQSCGSVRACRSGPACYHAESDATAPISASGFVKGQS